MARLVQAYAPRTVSQPVPGPESRPAPLRVRELRNFDFIILGSIGPVFGNYQQTLQALEPCLTRSGINLIDDGYITEGSGYAAPWLQSRQAILEQIAATSMRLVAEVPSTEDQSVNYAEQLGHITARCSELSEMHPESGSLFTD